MGIDTIAGDESPNVFKDFDNMQGKKQVLLSGCCPTEWRKNGSKNCESIEQGNLLTQLECLSCSVSLSCLRSTDVVSSSPKLLNSDAKKHSENAYKLWLY